MSALTWSETKNKPATLEPNIYVLFRDAGLAIQFKEKWMPEPICNPCSQFFFHQLTS